MAHFSGKPLVVKSRFADIPGSCRYCSEEAAETIRKELEKSPRGAIHLLGSGDYHYVCLFLLERLKTPFTLVLFDNHPDDQGGAFGEELLSCGGWVARARDLPLCREVLWNPEETPQGRNVYLSVDLDVLSEEHATTNWNQGEMSLEDLLGRIRAIKENNRMEGVDICGAIPEDPDINAAVTGKIIEVFL